MVLSAGSIQTGLFCCIVLASASRPGVRSLLSSSARYGRADFGEDAAAVGDGQDIEQRKGLVDDAVGAGDCPRGTEHRDGLRCVGRIGGEREPAQGQRLGVQRLVGAAGLLQLLVGLGDGGLELPGGRGWLVLPEPYDAGQQRQGRPVGLGSRGRGRR